MAAVELRNVHKRFRIPHEKHTTLTERLLAAFRPVTYEHFEALRGVDLTIEEGRFVGVIGGNGSGKSTLLKIISGLLPPDQGTVSVNGSMSALLELGLGFSNELTVRENVELYAAVLGYPRREAHRRVDEAIDFAGLERFRDAKLKNLSTGMRARLGFATALQAESDILLLDEILAVGDADFQMKCLNVFEDLRRRRRTMVLVTHDLRQVQHFCDEAVWLREGQIACVGDPDEVIRAYLQTIGAAPAQADAASLPQRVDGQMRVLRGWIEDDEGQRVRRVRCGDMATLVVEAEILTETDQPTFGFGLKADDRSLVYCENTAWLGMQTETLCVGTLQIRARFVAALRNARYGVQFGIGDRLGKRFLDLVDDLTSFVVYGSQCQQAVTDFGGWMSYIDLQGRITWQLVPDATRQEPPDAQRIAAADEKGGVR